MQEAAAPWSLFRKCSQPCFLLINSDLAQRSGPRGDCSPKAAAIADAGGEVKWAQEGPDDSG